MERIDIKPQIEKYTFNIDDSVDVVVCTETLTDAQLAQIMDIVMRKTKIAAENIIISQVTQ